MTHIDWTIEDARIAGWVACKFARAFKDWAWTYTLRCIDSDRHEAELIHALTHLETACPRCKVFGLRIEVLSPVPAVRRSLGLP